MSLNDKQHDVLLRPLNPARVSARQQAGRSLSYLEAWDVKAHLIRIFGFGGWSADVLSADLAFEDQTQKGSWNVGYKVVLRLSIPNLYCTYTEAAVGQATLPQRGEAHDMAVKTAESDALKRAAINLGDQFGLSLYNNGSLKPAVGTVLARIDKWDGSTIEPTTDSDVQTLNDDNPGEGDAERDALIAEAHDDLIEAMNLPDLPTRLTAVTLIQTRMRTAGLEDAVMPSGVTFKKACDIAIAGGTK